MKIVIHIKKAGRDIKWSDCSKIEQKKIARQLNEQGATAIGYKVKGEK